MKNYITATIIGIAAIVFAFVLGNAYKYKYKSAQTVSVTGSASIDFTSDLIVWSASFSQSDMDLKTAYNSLKQEEAQIKDFLANKNIPANAISFSSVDMAKNTRNIYNDKGDNIGSEFAGYTLTEKVTVSSGDIPLVEKLDKEISELLEQGIEINASAPNYYYTKLNDLKIDLLAKAASDARLRAETIAKNSKASIGKIRNASMGIFQIIGKNTNEEFSDGGAFNVSSKAKTATITMRVEYGLN